MLLGRVMVGFRINGALFLIQKTKKNLSKIVEKKTMQKLDQKMKPDRHAFFLIFEPFWYPKWNQNR